MNLYRPPYRPSVLFLVLVSVGFLAMAAIAVWQYLELQRAEARIEELESGGGGGILDQLDETFQDAFEQGLGALEEGAGDLAACLLPDEPFSAAPVAGLPVDEQIAAIADAVERLRGLRFREPVEPQFLSPAAISARIRELFLEEYTPDLADQEARILSALGAIPPGTDLRTLRADLLGSQVAGFYDPQTGELVVRQAGAELTTTDRIVLAHELDHALTDQVLGLPVPNDLRAGSEDRDLAATALVEGDATLLMQRYSASLPFEEQVGALDPASLADAFQAQSALSDIPPYLQAEARFPYEAGLSYACRRYAEGGWGAVDAAYDDPPDSTLEVLFPNRARARPRPVDVGGLLLTPWERVATGQLGPAQLLWLFEAPGGDPSSALSAAPAAVGEWMGGSLELWRRGPDSAVGAAIAERSGETSLCTVVTEWYVLAFDDDEERRTRRFELVADGPSQDAVVACSGGEIRLGIAPDVRTAVALAR